MFKRAWLEDIIIPDNRQRREFNEDKIKELAVSIQSKGLLHPIVARQNQENRQELILVAGERRLRAIKYLHEHQIPFKCDGTFVIHKQIPYTLFSELSSIAIREAELEENVIREDLTLQERASAIRDLHKLRLKQNPDHNQADTAEEISGSRQGSTTKVRDMMLVAEHQHLPEVAKAASLKDALKAIKKSNETEMLATLAELYPNQQDKELQVHYGDAKNCILNEPDGLFDCILTDPPYGVGADTFGDQSDLGHNYPDAPVVLDNIMNWFPKESYRITKPEAHLYFFCDIRRFQWLSARFLCEGWNVWEKPLIWSKGNGMLPQPDHGPRYTYDAILYANKGQKRINFVASDVLTYSAVAGQKLLHAAQKPVELYLDLLRRSCLQGDFVLDPFAGSGTIFEAAKALNLHAYGYEQEEGNYNKCLARIKGAL